MFSRIVKGNPVYTETADYTLSINIELEMSDNIKTVDSPTHEIVTKISGKHKKRIYNCLLKKINYLIIF